MFEYLDLITKEGENVSGTVAGLQLGHQRMRKKVFLCLLLIFFHRSVKDDMQVGRRGSCGGCLSHSRNGGGEDELSDVGRLAPSQHSLV